MSIAEETGSHYEPPEIFPDRFMGSTKLTPSPREVVLRGATEAVMRQRNNTYGPPTQDFRRTAGVLNALGYRFEDSSGTLREIDPHDVAMIQQAVKLSRLTWSPGNLDSWMDIAGYAACGYECAEEEARVEAAAKVLEDELD